MDKKLSGKVAIVTGSSSGIGECVAKRFAKEGASVVVVCDHSTQSAKRVCDELKNIGSDSIYVKADVSKESDIDKLIDTVISKYGHIDILVNNAGISTINQFSDVTFDSLEKDMRVNAFAPFILSQKVAKFMDSRGGGWIINTSSFRSIDPRPTLFSYCASKAALNNITQSLALQLAPKIYVNAVLPGFVETENYKKFDSKLKENWIKQTPIGRFILGDELADIYVLLATTKIMTGTLIVADGGFSLLGR